MDDIGNAEMADFRRIFGLTSPDAFVLTNREHNIRDMCISSREQMTVNAKSW